MYDDYDSRSIAQHALGLLMQRECSTAAAVRAVYRISTLLGHAKWQAWALLQLATADGPDELEPTKDALVEAFSESVLARENAKKWAGNAYLADRTAPEDDKRFLPNCVDDIESNIRILEASISRGDRVPGDREVLKKQITILARVKTRALQYLTHIESRKPIQSDDEGGD